MRIPALGLKRKQWEPLAFASPSMALIAFVIVFPLAYSFYLSFQNYDLSIAPTTSSWVQELRRAIFRTAFLGSVGTPR
jgi:ABC-type sugar transport system permease subunit